MKRDYELAGLCCGGCVNSVKRALLPLPGIIKVEVHLSLQRAVLTMSKPIDVEELQSHLNKLGHFSIKEAILN